MGDTAGPLFDQAGHIRELEAEIARLHEHEKIRAQTIAEHRSRLIAADALLRAVRPLVDWIDEVGNMRCTAGEVMEGHVARIVDTYRATT